MKRTKTIWEYQERLNYLREFYKPPFRTTKNLKPWQKSWITKRFRKNKLIDNSNHVFIPQSQTKLKQFKKRGHYTTQKGIFLPRIKTDKITQTIDFISPEIIVYRVGTRIDVQYNFTKKEKIALIRGESIEPIIERLKKKAGMNYDVVARLVFVGNNGSVAFKDATLAERMDLYLSGISQNGEQWLTGVRVIGFRRKSQKGKRRR